MIRKKAKMEKLQRIFFTDIEVAERYGISRATIWRWAKAGTFPKPKKLNGSSRWDIRDIKEFEDNLHYNDEIELIEEDDENDL